MRVLRLPLLIAGLAAIPGTALSQGEAPRTTDDYV
jgi:hypothetical protein